MTTQELMESGHRCDEAEITKFHPQGQTRFIEEIAKSFCIGEGVDVGCKNYPLPGAEGIDIAGAYATGKTLEDFPDKSLDYIFSSHMLEHLPLEEVGPFMELCKKKLKPRRGVLFFFLPHPCVAYWNPDLNPEAANWHLWVPTFEIVSELLKDYKFRIVDGNAHVCEWGSFWVCAKR